MNTREKSIKKRRNILRNNVVDVDKIKMERYFFPRKDIMPWWLIPAKKEQVETKTSLFSSLVAWFKALLHTLKV